MRAAFAVFFTILSLGIPQRGIAQTVRSHSLRAGAAKVDVTPAQSELPKTYEGIFDHLYSRAIVFEDGTMSAALITVDAGAIPDPIWRTVTQQLEKELAIPAANVLLTATHTHSAPMQQRPDYAQKIVESVKLAKQRLAPAKVGYGTGVSYINVNRNIIDPKTKRWWEGPNYDGPSDKTVAVIKVVGPGQRRRSGDSFEIY
jgi:neutral/alkaline ceramidase-like enzyme